GLVSRSLALIEAARARGVDVTADQSPYPAGSTSLYAVVQNDAEGTAGIGAADWNTIVIASAPAHPQWEGASVAELVARFDTTPADAAKKVVDAEGYGAVVILHSMDEHDVRMVMAHAT